MLFRSDRVGQGPLNPFPPTVGSRIGGVPYWVRFQFPPRQTQHADFPHYAFPAVAIDADKTLPWVFAARRFAPSSEV